MLETKFDLWDFDCVFVVNCDTVDSFLVHYCRISANHLYWPYRCSEKNYFKLLANGFSSLHLSLHVYVIFQSCFEVKADFACV